MGVNVPLGEFLNSGSFDTTYMDDEIRISRSKVGIFDQLRVFIKSDVDRDSAEKEGEDLFYDSVMSKEYMADIAELESKDSDISGDSAPSDVED